MNKTIEKVTGFVTRAMPTGIELLLFHHPHAGIQIPAGTMNPGESPAEAVTREIAEETGLVDITISQYLGAKLEKLPENQGVIAVHTKVYARPDLNSFDWAYIRPGITVSIEREAPGFNQILYQEYDRVPEHQFVSMLIKGWVPENALAESQRRHFYRLEFEGESEDHWQVFADHHLFVCFWAPLNNLPDIISPQDEWLSVLKEKLN
jgi:8-oxo-dGTP pyrophosphatase MutT (NUDIX family)